MSSARASFAFILLLVPVAVPMAQPNAIPLRESLPDTREIIIGAGSAGAPAIPQASLGGERDSHLREGWPVDLGAPGSGYPYTPTLFDADGDGAAEIFLTGGHTFGLRGDGSFLPGWPTSEMLYMGYGTNANKPGPSVADLEQDGDWEILWSQRDWYAGSAHMWSFNGRDFDGSDLPGFPQDAVDESSNALDTPFVLGDTDNDGILEAWGPHTRGNNFVHYRLSAFDHLGDRIFTVDLNPAENIVCLYFGDLDGDGDEEMFAVSWLDPSYYLHVFESDGSEALGYPTILHTFSSGWLPFGPPIPADLDLNGDLEFLFGHWDGAGSRALCKHHDGTPVLGFPIEIASDSQLFYLGLGDVTGDGAPELLAYDNELSADYRAFAIDLNTGLLLAGWPYALPSWPKGFPIVADVDNDAVQDLCIATEAGAVYAISGSGQLLAGYPKQMAGASISGVAVGDIDGDGYFELVAATADGLVYAWDTTGAALPGRADWPLRGVDARNTGVFRRGDLTAVAAGAPLQPTSRLRLMSNPVRTRAEFRIEFAPADARVEIFDTRGRRVALLPANGDARLGWQPQPNLASGVYLARLRGDRSGAALSFVLLR